MATASARHILVEDENICNQIKEQIENGDLSFSEAAEQYSLCPSGESGGDLGNFSEGQMVPEFDKVVFTEALNVVHGPVQTDFGFHLLEITERSN